MPRQNGPAPGRVATVRDVARRAKVSTATVSRVLAGIDVVSDQLARRVQAAAERLQYRPNRVARSLRERHTRTIGVLIPNIQNPFFTGAVRGIEDVLHGAGYTLLLGNSDDNASREKTYLDLFRSEAVSGLILVPGLARARAYRETLAGRLPVVAIDRILRDLHTDSVTVANTEGAVMAVRHLLKLGHRRIGIITGPVHVSTADERLAGYLGALEEAGIVREPQLIHRAPFRPEGGYEATMKLLASRRRPTALFAGSDVTALGVLRALHERGVGVPGDMAVTSFDDMPFADALQPPLTSIAQPTYELGATAARLILERIREPERPLERIRLPTKLVVRASCGARSDP